MNLYLPVNIGLLKIHWTRDNFSKSVVYIVVYQSYSMCLHMFRHSTYQKLQLLKTSTLMELTYAHWICQGNSAWINCNPEIFGNQISFYLICSLIGFHTYFLWEISRISQQGWTNFLFLLENYLQFLCYIFRNWFLLSPNLKCILCIYFHVLTMSLCCKKDKHKSFRRLETYTFARIIIFLPIQYRIEKNGKDLTRSRKYVDSEP